MKILPRDFYVTVRVKLDDEWDKWAEIPAFVIKASDAHSDTSIARKARMIVDRKGESTVRVLITYRADGAHGKEFTFQPIKF